MGCETSKAYRRRVRDGYFERILAGHGIDIGCGDDPITADCVHWDREQGDASTLPGIPPTSFDWVYSSHCLEHLHDPAAALRRWIEVVRPGGHLVVTVPEEDLYEQGVWPSTFNSDHKWTFTMAKAHSWSPRSINVIDLVREHAPTCACLKIELLDNGYRYNLPRFDQTRTPCGEAGIEIVLRKLLPDPN